MRGGVGKDCWGRGGGEGGVNALFESVNVLGFAHAVI